MTDQTNGLRFDVYERVHLPDDVAAIDELEEIELVPRIQVIEQGDHAVLKGQLLLSGIYRSQSEDGASEALEHWIPVEISLPMNRVSKLEDISVEIENFDVDLLSSRTLNITGVLSLRGILVEQLPEAAEPWREEPFTVVHRRDGEEGFAAFGEQFGGQFGEQEAIPEDSAPSEVREPEADAASETPAAFAEEQAEAPAEAAFEAQEPVAQPLWEPVQRPDDGDAPGIAEAPVPGPIGWSASPWYVPEEQQERTQSAAPEEKPESEGWSAAAEQDYYFAQESEREPEIEPETAPASYAEPEPEEPSSLQPAFAEREEAAQAAEPEKQEMKIAFGAKQEESPESQAPGVGLMTLLQTSKREQAARQAAEDTAAQQKEAKRSEAYGEEIEWSNLFLGKQSEEREFRKIRVCIVQKEETLESIAIRYSMNPREILLHNRLTDSVVSEGQLLYIP